VGAFLSEFDVLPQLAQAGLLGLDRVDNFLAVVGLVFVVKAGGEHLLLVKLALQLGQLVFEEVEVLEGVLDPRGKFVLVHLSFRILVDLLEFLLEGADLLVGLVLL